MECSKTCSQELKCAFQDIPFLLDNIEMVAEFFVTRSPKNNCTYIPEEVALLISWSNNIIQLMKDRCEDINSELNCLTELNEVKRSQLSNKIKSAQKRIYKEIDDIIKLTEEQSTASERCKKATTELQNARELLSNAKTKLEDIKTARNVVRVASVPLIAVAPFAFFIPVVGPIVTAVTLSAGSGMAVSSFTIIEKQVSDKKSVVSGAEHHKTYLQSRLTDLNNRIKSLQKNLQNAISKNTELLEEESYLNQWKYDVINDQKKISNFLGMFKTGFHELTVTSGRSHVLNTYTQIGYNRSHLTPLLLEFFEAFAKFSDEKLLEILNIKRCDYKSQIQSIRFKMKQILHEQRPELEFDIYSDLV